MDPPSTAVLPRQWLTLDPATQTQETLRLPDPSVLHGSVLERQGDDLEAVAEVLVQVEEYKEGVWREVARTVSREDGAFRVLLP